MPELPEVETTRRGIEPWLTGQRIATVTVRQRQLRWPVPARLNRQLPGAVVRAVDRRAKFLLLRSDPGTALVHLGMTGRLRVVTDGREPGVHDHVDFVLGNGHVIRFSDPRRFGSVLWTAGPAERHPLLRELGPEPLGPGFDGDYLHGRARARSVAIKPFLMNSRIVVGVGNIYASEALYRAGIDPRRAAGKVSRPRMAALAAAVRAVLEDALQAGGTTLRDYVGSDGEPGYFSTQLRVYDRAGEPCLGCGAPLRQVVLGQRSTYFCARCQR
jgi:formamidopyrimidine-DNA glycosylase